MYTTSTVSVMTCDNCGKQGHPHPEADGSLGLVPGWCHYDPKFIGTAVRLSRRYDFCSVDCRDLWLKREVAKFLVELQSRMVIYQFGERPYSDESVRALPAEWFRTNHPTLHTPKPD